MTPNDKLQLQALWEAYGTAELIHRIGTILFDHADQMSDDDWKQECRDSSTLLFRIANAFYAPCPTSHTSLYKATLNLTSVPPLRERT